MLTDALVVGQCPVAVHAVENIATIPDPRGELLAAAIERSPEWRNFVAAMRLCDVAIGGAADLDPISRTIAEHFSSLAPHQRPERSDAAAALLRIEIVTRMLRWLAADKPKPSGSFKNTAAALGLSAAAPEAYSHRCLAPLYFPQQSCSWRTIVDGILAACLQEVSIRMLDGHCGGELIVYLSQTVDRATDAARTIRAHFATDVAALCRRLTSGPDWRDGAVCFANLRLTVDPAESAARWEVLWQWAAGEAFIAIPSALKSDAVDWENVERRHARVCAILGGPIERHRVGCDAAMSAIFSPQTNELQRSPEGIIDSIRSGGKVAVVEVRKEPEVLRCEVRMADDPGLSHSMRAVLERYRSREESLSLVRLSAIGADGRPTQSDGRKVAPWHDAVMAKLESWNCGELSLAFLTSQGDLGLLVGGLERSELVRKLRTELLSVGVSAATAAEASTSYSLVAGAATIANPRRYCELDQLFAAVDRCVQGAMLQGRGAVKSLDVF